MYINCTLKCFIFFSQPKVKHKSFNVGLVDEKKIYLVILRHAKIFLDKFWYTTNFKFDFVDQPDIINSSSCFKNCGLKPKFGRYNFTDYCHVTWEYH